ncbi:MAG: alpha/beta hydrolase [Synechococcaceae cyanobacterium]|nr:alpha/beta hydrolase [Synechococcaceae cyanobacterium]
MARSRWIRSGLPLLGVSASLLTAAAPGRALETIVLQLPLVQTTFTVKVGELRDPARLMAGNSDLAELDKASNGAIGRQMTSLFSRPLPVQTTAVARNLVGTPMLDQVLLLLSSLGEIDGMQGQQPDGQLIEQALNKAAAAPGGLTLVDALEALPGQTVTVNLQALVAAIDRLMQQQSQGLTLVKQGPAATGSPSLAAAGPNPTVRTEQSLTVAHRAVPLPVVVIAPGRGGNGRLVAISHGLWDSPSSFEGWGRHLASHGYTVVLPRHPDSDRKQQQAMFAGKSPPPTPQELLLRPKDVSAAIDAAGDGRLTLPAPVRTEAVAALGQSWGATTVLQLGGARTTAARLQRHCLNPKDPRRNLSWVLQCNFLNSANQGSIADPRVKAVVAVSPMLSLLFEPSTSLQMNAQALVVSGSRDWVVPSGPEALRPLQMARAAGGSGHRLVMAGGGDHFNLGSTYEDGGGPLRALLLSWVQAGLQAPTAAPGPGGSWLPATGWGDATLPLIDVSDRLSGLRF